MNANRVSLRHFVTSAALGIALMTTLGCDKKTDGASTASSTHTTTGAAAPATGKKPKATLKIADYRAAYKAQMDDMSKMRDPMDKKIAAVQAKVGAPFADTGRKKTWYALDGDSCIKIDLDTKDGGSMEQGTDKADCGL